MELFHTSVAWLGNLLSGSFGGVVGGAVTFLLLDLGAKSLKQRRDLADALAAELADNADAIQAILNDTDRTSIPQYYSTSDAVFKAVAGQLGILPHDDVATIAKHYRFLAQTNRLPEVWHARLRAAAVLVHNDPVRVSEERALRQVVSDFYGHLERLVKDCHNLGAYLRTAHQMSVGRLLPRRIRRAARISRRELPR